MQRVASPQLELTPLFGRGEDLALIDAQLAGDARLLTLTGPPGAGKTRLAREITRVALATDTWPGGVFFCDLRAARTIDDIVTSVASSLDLLVSDQVATKDTVALIGRHLGPGGRTLIALDNLEHLLSHARPLVATWLDAAPDLVLLTTSREGLGVPDEHCHVVSPLAVPAGQGEPLEAPAVQLFLRCAANLAVQLPTTGEGLDAIAALVVRLDGNPLAIELAAARTPLLSAKAILARLQRRFDVLGDGAARRGGLWEAINASWESLSGAEQRALMMVALFRGGASVEPLEALMAADPGYAGASPLDLLAALIRKSLATSTPSLEPGARRVELYEIIRDFALVRLAESPTVAGELTERYVHWALATLQTLGQRQFGVAAREVITQLQAELPNVLAALSIATAMNAPTQWLDAAATALLDGHALLAGFVPLERVRGIFDDVLALHTNLPLESRLRLVGHVGNYLARLNAPAEAEAVLERGVADALACGEPALEGLALKGFWGLVSHLAADKLSARMERAIELLATPRWRSDAAHAKATLAFALVRSGAFDRAEALFAEAVAELDGPSDEATLGATLNNWGSMLALRGQWDQAREVWERAYDIGRRANLRPFEAAVLCGLGECELKAGRLVTAREHFVESLDKAREAGWRRHAAVAAGYLAAIAHFNGDCEGAVTRYDEALAWVGFEWDGRLADGLIRSAKALAEAQLNRGDASERGFLRAHALLHASGDAALLAAHTIHRIAAAVALGHRDGAGAMEEAAALAQTVHSVAPVRLSHVEHALTLLRLVLAAQAAVPKDVVVSVGLDTAYIALADGTHLDLRRSAKTRRLVELLVERHLQQPGASVTVHDLFDAAWPGDRTPEPHRSNRVYVATTRLRNAGFGGLVLHDGDGYLLDPRATIKTGGEP